MKLSAKQQPFDGSVNEIHRVQRENNPWLASDDIAGFGDVPVTIAQVIRHDQAIFDEGRTENVFALKFEGKTKQMVLNRTNTDKLQELFGERTGDWQGKNILLYVVRTRMMGKEVNGIRIKGAKE